MEALVSSHKTRFNARRRARRLEGSLATKAPGLSVAAWGRYVQEAGVVGRRPPAWTRGFVVRRARRSPFAWAVYASDERSPARWRP